MTSKIVKCVDCGLKLPRKELNRKLRCKDCASNILRETMGQLMAHEGPHYEKWKKACRDKAYRYLAGITEPL